MPGGDAGSGETCVTFCVAETLSAVVSAIQQHIDPQLVCCVRLRTQSSSPHWTAQTSSTRAIMLLLSRVGPSQRAATSGRTRTVLTPVCCVQVCGHGQQSLQRHSSAACDNTPLQLHYAKAEQQRQLAQLLREPAVTQPACCKPHCPHAHHRTLPIVQMLTSNGSWPSC